MNVSVAIVMLVEPTVVQVEPSEEVNPVNVLPDRLTRTHLGGVALAPDMLAEVPPVELRNWKAVAPPAESSMCACLEPPVRVSRIMTPALAQTFVFSMPVTRARISPSPDSFL